MTGGATATSPFDFDRVAAVLCLYEGDLATLLENRGPSLRSVLHVGERSSLAREWRSDVIQILDGALIEADRITRFDFGGTGGLTFWPWDPENVSCFRSPIFGLGGGGFLGGSEREITGFSEITVAPFRSSSGVEGGGGEDGGGGRAGFRASLSVLLLLLELRERGSVVGSSAENFLRLDCFGGSSGGASFSVWTARNQLLYT